MTTDTREGMIALIREKCIEANPSILDLKFGCVFTYGRKGKKGTFIRRNTRDMVEFKTEDEGHSFCGNDDIIEIIGRPIRLADVLLAIWKKNPANRTNVVLESSGQFRVTHTWGGRRDIIVLGETWNLLEDDIDRQSDDTIEFLHGLLK